jgi:hypothetical protein
MANGDATPVFTDRDVGLIVKSLPNEVCPRRLELLPRVLCEWSRNELREHLSRESAAAVKKRAKRMKVLTDHAHGLLQELEALDDRDRAAIAIEMPRAGGDLWPKMRRHHRRETSEMLGMIQRIKEERDFLTKLIAAAPAAWKRAGRGRPRNIKAYLVIKDAAAIFEWLTKMEATRQVNSSNHEETGPFWKFLTAIWPVIFGQGDDGLPAAIKKWADYREKYREGCALIANINFRHPEWRLFEN